MEGELREVQYSDGNYSGRMDQVRLGMRPQKLSWSQRSREPRKLTLPQVAVTKHFHSGITAEELDPATAAGIPIQLLQLWC